jgi:ABC-type transport system involved in cytochrome c biogenesis ATPase subunit
MYLRTLELKDFRGFASLRWEVAEGEEAGWHVLMGPNGAGKTSVLRGDGDWIIGATRFCRNAPKPSRFYSRQLCCCGYQSGIIGNQHLG